MCYACKSQRKIVDMAIKFIKIIKTKTKMLEMKHMTYQVMFHIVKTNNKKSIYENYKKDLSRI
jgi:hypothetical protein